MHFTQVILLQGFYIKELNQIKQIIPWNAQMYLFLSSYNINTWAKCTGIN